MAPHRKMPPPVLFLNIGWATEYRGGRERPIGKFRYITEGGENAGENLNFKAYNGRYYGYAPVRSVNVAKLGALPKKDYANKVLVVWTATHPVQGGSYIIGWYRNARVWAQMQADRPDEDRPDFIAEAAAKDCHLVPPERRTFWIPRTKEKGWPGMASNFYASENFSAERLAKVLAYVDGREPDSTGFAEPEDIRKDDDPSWPTRDPELRSRIEAAAVKRVTNHYKDDGWTVRSVEKEKLGWDLEATKVQGRLKLCIEVKGRGGDGSVELTPNEYTEMMRAANRPFFRLAIVHHALSANPDLTIFQWVERQGWVGDNGEVLQLTPKTGAVASFERQGHGTSVRRVRRASAANARDAMGRARDGI